MENQNKSFFDTDVHRRADKSKEYGISNLSAKMLLANNGGFSDMIEARKQMMYDRVVSSLKKKIDPLNWVYKLTGSKELTTIAGNKMGRSAQDINYYTKTFAERKKSEKIPGLELIKEDQASSSQEKTKTAYSGRTTLKASAPGIMRQDSDRDILVKIYKILYDTRQDLLKSEKVKQIKEEEKIAQDELKKPGEFISTKKVVTKKEENKEEEGSSLFSIISSLGLLGNLFGGFTSSFETFSSLFKTLLLPAITGITEVLSTKIAGILTSIVENTKVLLVAEEFLLSVGALFKNIPKLFTSLIPELITGAIALFSAPEFLAVLAAAVIAALATAGYNWLTGGGGPGDMSPPGVAGVPTEQKDQSQYTAPSSSKSMTTANDDEKAARGMQILMDKGWTKEQAAGILGTLYQESGFDTQKEGDKDKQTGEYKALGLAQWHKDRRDIFEKVVGKPVRQATFEEQLAFVDWELKNTEKSAGNQIKQAKTAREATTLTEQKYERSALGLAGGVSKNALLYSDRFAKLDVSGTKKEDLVPIKDKEGNITGYMKPAPEESKVQPQEQTPTATPIEQQTPPAIIDTAQHLSAVQEQQSRIAQQLGISSKQNQDLKESEKSQPIIVKNVQQPQQQQPQQTTQQASLGVGLSVRNDEPIFEKISMQNWRKAIV